ncbi:MAG: hypothetical protein HUK15_03455 [Bacteroidales bacterium]|nr:hypothetical protein [Bacteroidales bacterium]
MEQNEIKELRKKILNGLNLSYRKLLQTKKQQNATLVVSEDGKVVQLEAKKVRLKVFKS